MPKRAINPDELKDPTGRQYSHMIVDEGKVYMAGQVGIDAEDNIVSSEFEPQARKALENVGVLLEEVDRNFDDVAKVTCLIVDPQDHWEEFSRVYGEFWSEEPYPCLTVIGVPELAREGLLIEVEVEFNS